MEVLAVASYREDIIEAAAYTGLDYMGIQNPLTGFCTRYQSSSQPNRMLMDATRCFQRCEKLLARIWHPVAKEFYEDLSKRAQELMMRAREQGANVTAEELFPSPARGKGDSRAPNNSRRGRIRRRAVLEEPANDARVPTTAGSGGNQAAAASAPREAVITAPGSPQAPPTQAVPLAETQPVAGAVQDADAPAQEPRSPMQQ